MERRKRIVWGLVVGIAVLAVGVTAVLARSGGGEILLTAEDDGRAVALGVGETMAVALEANPSTGYAWEVAAVDDSVLRADEWEFVQGGEGALLGAGGTQVLRFTALAEGETVLELVHRRSWESEEPLGHVRFAVSVR